MNNEEKMIENIGKTIEDVRKAARCRVFFHVAVPPMLASYLRQTPPDIRPSWCMDGHVLVTEDRDLRPMYTGGCVLTTPELYEDMKKQYPSIFAGEEEMV